MSLEGYKAFKKGLFNRYGVQFKEHQDYVVDLQGEDLKYGNNGNGFHFAKRLEDCLRYYNGFEEEIDIAKVVSLGDFKESFDDYYGYYDLYVTNHLYIDHVMTREEILNYIIGVNNFRVVRFIQGYKLTPLEIMELLKKYPNDNSIIDAIKYYQYHDDTAYVKRYRQR